MAWAQLPQLLGDALVPQVESTSMIDGDSDGTSGLMGTQWSEIRYPLYCPVMVDSRFCSTE